MNKSRDKREEVFKDIAGFLQKDETVKAALVYPGIRTMVGEGIETAVPSLLRVLGFDKVYESEPGAWDIVKLSDECTERINDQKSKYQKKDDCMRISDFLRSRFPENSDVFLERLLPFRNFIREVNTVHDKVSVCAVIPDEIGYEDAKAIDSEGNIDCFINFSDLFIYIEEQDIDLTEIKSSEFDSISKDNSSREKSVSGSEENSDRKFMRLVKSSPNGLLFLDRDLNITDINPAFKDLFKCSDAVIGRHVSYVLDPEPFEELSVGNREKIERTEEFSEYNIVCRQILYALRDEKEYVGIFMDITKAINTQAVYESMKKDAVSLSEDLLKHNINTADKIVELIGESTARGEEILQRLKSTVENSHKDIDKLNIHVEKDLADE